MAAIHNTKFDQIWLMLAERLKKDCCVKGNIEAVVVT